ncbi:sensor histidine kinase [Promicromonospora sp. NFX87]|uniref:sensor histidine kinase n=1 Tax=Promicromonospora sp. NFX87 TaxID=3402691 RepID=UPI003AFB637A
MRTELLGMVARGWPLAGLLLLAFALDNAAASDVPGVGRPVEVVGSLTVSVLAMAAARWPAVAGIGTASVLLLSSSALRVADVAPEPASAGLGAVEAVATLAVVVAVARRSPRYTAVGVVVLLTLCWLLVPALRSGQQPQVPGWGAVLPVLAILAGCSLRARDARRARELQAVADAARLRERVALARELHDVVAHHIGGMVVQAQAAQVVAGPDPGAPARVLPAIERAGTQALSAMERMIATLGSADHGPSARSSDLATDLRIVTAVPDGGTPTRLSVELAEPVPAEVATAVLRIVQESVTNARRYATGAHEIAVTVRAGNGTVRVWVRDDGRHPGPSRRSGGGGYGLVGMRERAELLGGRLDAGRAAAGGWQVLADIPLRAAETGAHGTGG